MKKTIIIISSITIVLTATFLVYNFLFKNKSKNETNPDWDASEISYIHLKQNKVELENANVILDETTINIIYPGTYKIDGTLDDGKIIINVKDNEEVNLILNNANITCSNYAVITIENANKTTITLEGENIITDGTKYTNLKDEEPDAAIFSHDDLIINGSGSLTVNANYKDGIASKDDLEIYETNLIINSNDDGIRGKDSLVITDSNLKITSVGDAIKSTNTEDNKGYVEITNSEIKIESKSDGIDSEQTLTITNSNLNIKTTNGNDSTKGIKSSTLITVNSGTLEIDSYDDAVHSNKDIIINGGTFNLSTNDDGIHADNKLEINEGTINITKSYEGLEAAELIINNGNINLVSTDDGINAAGGNDINSGSYGGPGGRDQFSTSTGTLTIRGGNIKINASGDGIDVNGDALIEGGTIYVDGPTNSGNGALDYDGTFKITGGTLIAVGASGMAEAPSTSSTQYIIMINQGTMNGTLKLTDSNDNEIITYTPSKQYQSVVISSPNIKNNTTYNLVVNGTEIISIMTNGILTTSGNGGMMNPGRR